MQERVLLIDDRIDDISWLVDDLNARGCKVDQVANEEAARSKLDEIKKALDKGQRPFVLAIIDIMIPVMDIMDLLEIDESFFEDSAMSGVRLCRYARETLQITEGELPIVALTARSDDDDIRKDLRKVGIQHTFSRVPQSDEQSIRSYLERLLARAETD
jgi:CheY-like chemotaxis protein